MMLLMEVQDSKPMNENAYDYADPSFQDEEYYLIANNFIESVNKPDCVL